MPRATSLLPRLSLLALAFISGCAFPFFRSKDKSLEEMVTVEAISEEERKTPTVEPTPGVTEKQKPLPPIARFFGGLFGRGKSKPQPEPLSTIPSETNTPSASLTTTPQPKVEFNNTGDVGAGVVPPKSTEPIPTAAPQVSNLAEMTPSPTVGNQASPVSIAAEPKSAPPRQPQPAELVNPHAIAKSPEVTPEKPAPSQHETMPNPSKQTFASQSKRSPSGSLTAALRNALDEATKDGLAEQSSQQPQSIAAKLSGAPSSNSNYSTPAPTPAPAMAATPATAPTPASIPTPSRIVELSSSPIGATKPEQSRAQLTATPPNPAPIAEKVLDNPTASSPRIVTAAQKSGDNPLRDGSTAPQSRMIDLATQPFGAKPEKPQTVYPTQETKPETEMVDKPAEVTTLVAFQTHVHSGDSIINQLKQSRRVNQFRPMYDSEVQTPTAAMPESVSTAVNQTPTQEAVPSVPVEVQPRPMIVAAAPSQVPVEKEAPIQPSAFPENPTVVAAKPTPVPVELALPVQPPTPQLPTDFAATIPLENPATSQPAKIEPEPIRPPVRPDSLSQLVPTEAPVSSVLLEQPGSVPAEPTMESPIESPPQQLAVTPPNPVRAVPRVAVAPQTSSSSTANPLAPSRPTPQIATRPIPEMSPVATPNLAPVVTIEEYRRMQQQRRNQATRRY